MDLFKTRCGCGAIFTPGVRTQRVCTTCDERNHQRARAQLPAGHYKEPKAKVDGYQDQKWAEHARQKQALFGQPFGMSYKDMTEQLKQTGWTAGVNEQFQSDAADALRYAVAGRELFERGQADHARIVAERQRTKEAMRLVATATCDRLEAWGSMLRRPRHVVAVYDLQTSSFVNRLETDDEYRNELRRGLFTGTLTLPTERP